MNTNKIDLIKAEVERLYNQSLVDENRQADRGLECAANVSYGQSKACKQLLSFIDSLQEEPVSEELEQAVNVYIGYAPDVVESLSTYVKRLAFKAGAKWQKEQDKETIELAEDHAMLAGMEKMKQQMINKACDWLKNWSYGYLIEKYDETDIDRNELVKDFKKYMED